MKPGSRLPQGGAEAVVMTFVMPRREGVCLLKPRLVTPEGRCIEGVERRLMVARKGRSADRGAGLRRTR